jgi:S1-C subfamily serine protease
MPQFFKQLFGIILLVVYCTSCGCATLFNSVNFKNAPRSSFVKIEIITTDGYMSTGSGVIINHLDNLNTIILTAGHICKDNTLAMRVLDLFEQQHAVASFVTAKEDDLCIIVINDLIDGEPIKMSEESAEIGDHVYNIAAPRAIHAPNMSLMFDGYYQGRMRVSEEKYALDIYSVAGKGGSSGSPVFNENWKIIGIISRGMEDFQHVMLSINHERTKKFYDYSFSDQFKIDVHLATIEYNKKLLDYMNKLILK